VQVVARRGPFSYEGWVDGAEAIVRVCDATHPVGDPTSAFFGGQGLLPPFRPLVHHEALVWARVEPYRLLAHGLGPEGPYVALRRLPGIPLSALVGGVPFDVPCVEAVLRHVATELAALHAAGVVHRELGPRHVLLVDGRVRLAGLAGARMDGLGPPGLHGPGGADGDLLALGALVAWMLGTRPLSALGSAAARVAAALSAPNAADRPGSANEVLAALDAPGGPPADLTPPHPALVAWPQAAWADRPIAQGHPWEVVRHVDAIGADRWALAAAAGRLLEARKGADGWLALGTLCWALAERCTGAERDAYAAQAEEARARAGVAWHPSAVGLASLLAGGARPGPLCDTGQRNRVATWARAEGEGGALALAGWRAGDDSVVEEGLADARPDDVDGLRVAASRLLLADPREAPASAVRLALPDAQLDAVRRLCAQGAEAEAHRLVALFPDPIADRARLQLALAGAERGEALTLARGLARRGAWDATVAATLVTHAPDSEPLRAHARRVLEALAPRVDHTRLRARASAAVSVDPGDLVAWSGLVCARVAAGELERLTMELERASPAASAACWSLFALELLSAGHLEEARVAVNEATRRHPDDAAIAAMDAALSLLDGDPASAARAAAHGAAQEPGAPWGWLAQAACATWVGDADRARAELSAAARAGARGRAFTALDACVPNPE
jgi:hypothetical protein